MTETRSWAIAHGLLASALVTCMVGLGVAATGGPAGAATTAGISAVGSLVTHTLEPSQASESVPVAPSAVGDLLALAVETKFPVGSAFAAGAVTGGGVTTWNKAIGYVTRDGRHGEELWWGIVTRAGASTLTVGYPSSSAGTSGSATSVDVQELRSAAGSGTTWTLDRTGALDTGVASTTPAYPTLTASTAAEAYVGYLAVPGSVSTGTTPGVVYQSDARGNQVAYDVAVTGTLSPISSSSSQTYASIAMLVAAAYPTSSTPATISAVGGLRTHTNQPALQQESISVSPAAVGDVLVLAVETKFPGTPSFTAASVTGGGVSSWRKALGYLTSDGYHGQELWWGVVTKTGAGTLTVGYTSGSTSGTSQSASSLDVQELAASTGATASWSLDGTGRLDTGVPSTSPAYPTLAPSSSKEAYVGYLAVPGSVSKGSTPGVVYQGDARGNQVAYATSVSATLTPTSTASSQTFASIGLLLRAG
jgi:hypothetical protein